MLRGDGGQAQRRPRGAALPCLLSAPHAKFTVLEFCRFQPHHFPAPAPALVPDAPAVAAASALSCLRAFFLAVLSDTRFAAAASPAVNFAPLLTAARRAFLLWAPLRRGPACFLPAFFAGCDAPACFPDAEAEEAVEAVDPALAPAPAPAAFVISVSIHDWSLSMCRRSSFSPVWYRSVCEGKCAGRRERTL